MITDPTWIFFVVLGIILFAPVLMERLRVPSVVGMILAGVLVGPGGFGVLQSDASFEIFGKVGLYYIMFLASLEMNLQDVHRLRTPAVVLGLLSFAVPMLLGMPLLGGLLGYSLAASALLGAMLASHTLITYPAVLRYGLSRRRPVSIAVGGTIVADTLTLLVLALVGGSFKEHTSQWFVLLLMGRVVVLGGCIVWLFPPLARWFFRRWDDSVAQFIFVLALVFLGAGLMEFVGMQGILGAFLSGIVLNRCIPPSSPLMSHIEFVGNALFIPYFLIGVGMLIDVRSLTTSTLLLAVAMSALGLGGKWLAAELTGRALRMERGDRTLMFGLTGARAAATLAVVLVGHGIVLPSGQPLLSGELVGAAMLFILISCVVSSFCTERTARALAVRVATQAADTPPPADRIVLALSYPDTVVPLVGMALALHTPGSATPLTALNVVLEDDDSSRESGLALLGHAEKMAATTGVKLITRSRWAVNVASGICHTMREFDASDLLLGLHTKKRLSDTFYGKVTTDLLHSLEQQLLLYRAFVPLGSVRRIHVLVPRKAEFETGFHHWADRVALLSQQTQSRVETYGGRGTLEALAAYWKGRGYAVESEAHIYTEWSNLLTLAHQVSHDHLLVVVMARPGTLSRHRYMDHIPLQLERNFSQRNLLVVYPTQQAASADRTSARTGLPLVKV